jgi:hypothetical protein
MPVIVVNREVDPKRIIGKYLIPKRFTQKPNFVSYDTFGHR